MPRRWVAFGLLLAGGVLLRVFYTGWLAGVVLWAILCLPLLGVALALPGVLSCRLRVEAETERVPRGGEARWRVSGRSALGLPLGRVKVSVESACAMSGGVRREKRTWFLPGAGGAAEVAAPAEHCGLLTGRIVSAWATDCLGLFWLPLFRGGEGQIWVEPIPRTAGLPPLPQEEAPGVRPRPGGGPGEDYDPRPYRPGDPLNSIHWKLSAKRDELVTRETLETVRQLPLLTFDCFGTPEEVDGTLDVLAGTARALLSEGRAFSLAWAEPVTGEVRRFDVNGAEDWKRCLEAVLSQRAPETGKSVLDVDRLGRSLHLTGGGGA